MNKLIPIIIAGIIFVGGGVAYFAWSSSNNSQKNTPSDNQSSKNDNKETDQNIQISSEEDVIRNFFQLIQERKISEAVLSMSLQNTSNDSVKQAWGVQFNSINSVSIGSIEPSLQEEWNTSKHTYRVVLNMAIDPNSADESIPYYGYVNGENIRFIPIIKEGDLWKVDGIATGP